MFGLGCGFFWGVGEGGGNCLLLILLMPVLSVHDTFELPVGHKP